MAGRAFGLSCRIASDASAAPFAGNAPPLGASAIDLAASPRSGNTTGVRAATKTRLPMMPDCRPQILKLTAGDRFAAAMFHVVGAGFLVQIGESLSPKKSRTFSNLAAVSFGRACLRTTSSL